MSDEERCPHCGYTEYDKRLWMDHHLCDERQKVDASRRRAGELSALCRSRAKNEQILEALEQIWLEVKGGAYQGVDYSPQIARIKGICGVVRAALAGKEQGNG